MRTHSDTWCEKRKKKKKSMKKKEENNLFLWSILFFIELEMSTQ